MSEPAWAQGHDVGWLKQAAALFEEHDKGYVFGVFGTPNEAQLAEARTAGRLAYRPLEEDGPPRVVAITRQATSSRAEEDFTGQQRFRVEPGDIVVRRIAWEPGAEREARALLLALLAEVEPSLISPGRLWVRLLRESPDDTLLALELDLRYCCTAIPASSELLGWYVAGGFSEIAPQHPAEAAGITCLDSGLPISPLCEELAARGLGFAAHYSSKQKQNAWSGLSLRAYGPPGGPFDQEVIYKPAEMSRKWKQENPEKLEWVLGPTPLAAELEQAAAPLLAAVPGRHHRVRLLRLAPGGGELTRHADITDPDAGLGEGQLARIHIPLETNPGVMFTQWLLDGSQQLVHMAAGDMWYLDTRKPHRAVNGGELDRIHLVVDTEAGPALLERLAAAREWPA